MPIVDRSTSFNHTVGNRTEFIMIKNRFTQLIYRVAFLTISVFGIIESFGLFAGQKPGFECLLYYTSLSNFLCFGVILAATVSTLNHLKRGETEGYNTACPRFKFYSTIIILVTFIVYNFILADNMFEPGWNNLGNLTKHIVCPLMVVIDHLLFDEHRSLKWFDCLGCTVLPLIYVAVILVRAELLPAGYSGTVYPYFFLDADELGYIGVAIWVLVLLAAFILIAFLFYLYDKIKYENGKLTFKLKNN